MTKPRLFVRWKTRGRWSKWHIDDPRKYRYTLCGAHYTTPAEMTEVWTNECRLCNAKAEKQ